MYIYLLRGSPPRGSLFRYANDPPPHSNNHISKCAPKRCHRLAGARVVPIYTYYYYYNIYITDTHTHKRIKSIAGR